MRDVRTSFHPFFTSLAGGRSNEHVVLALPLHDLLPSVLNQIKVPTRRANAHAEQVVVRQKLRQKSISCSENDYGLILSDATVLERDSSVLVVDSH